jgi:polysaccharide biosynthesis protein PslH
MIQNAPMRCLWIGRYIPYPIDEGMKLYSAKLIESFAASGVEVCALGYGSSQLAPTRPGVRWEAVPCERGKNLGGIVSPLPIAAAVDGTPAYRSLLDVKLREHWDVIVLDSYASGWALERCQRYRTMHSHTILVHVSHNHEAAVWRSMAAESSASPLHRWLIKRNANKVAQLERELVRSVDLITTITDEDGRALLHDLSHDGLSVDASAISQLTLMPGFDGAVAKDRSITSLTRRRVIVVGSFNWVVKRENLSRFVQHADPIFADHGIDLVIAGQVPSDLQQSLSASCRATIFRGFVQDLLPLLSEARIAVVPELIGGGFKLKFLDYFLGRVPVATVTAAASGIPAPLREYLLMGEDIAALTQCIVDHIDQVQDLNDRQTALFEQAAALFRWEDRGVQLSAQIQALQARKAAYEDHRLLGS